MGRESEFFNLFNQLEKHLRVNYHKGDYSYSGFITRLYQIKKAKVNSLINNNHNFDLIKQAAQMRNIIAHNNDVLIPSQRFLSEFKELVFKITKPKQVKDVMTPFEDLQTRSLNSTIKEVIDLLKSSGFSSIPIVEKDELIGIFTEKSLFDYLSMDYSKGVEKSMLVSEIIDAIDLNNHPRRYFEFVSKELSIYEAYQIFNKDKLQRREMLLLLVTEKGDSNEHLLGLVALRDLEKQLIN